MSPVTVEITIELQMSFPEEWDAQTIESYLNGSSWCFSNIIDILKEYNEKHGCLCGICEAKVL